MAISTQTKKSDLSVISTEHPNVQRLRAAFEAFSKGDLDTVRASLTDDCVWTNGGTGALAGAYKGWAEIEGMFDKLITLTGGTFAMNVLSTQADGNFAIAIYDATSTVNGKHGTFRFVITDEMTPEGKVASTHTLAFDQAGADAHLNG